MVGAMAKMIRSYGSTMTLVRDGQEIRIRAFLQDTHSKSQENSRREFSALGEAHRGVFVYIGPAQPLAEEGNEIRYRGRSFELRRAEPVLVGDEVAYCWGLCVEKGGEDA